MGAGEVVTCSSTGLGSPSMLGHLQTVQQPYDLGAPLFQLEQVLLCQLLTDTACRLASANSQRETYFSYEHTLRGILCILFHKAKCVLIWILKQPLEEGKEDKQKDR